MERTPATVRHKLGPHPHDVWLSGRYDSAQRTPDAMPAAQTAALEDYTAAPATSGLPGSTWTAAQIWSTLRKRKGTLAILLLAGAALVIATGPVALAFVLASPAALAAAPGQDAGTALATGLLVWLPGLGACLALALYFEGDALRQLLQRVIRGTGEREE